MDPQPKVTARLSVDDVTVGTVEFRAVKTPRGRSMQFDYALRKLHRDYPDATRHGVSTIQPKEMTS